mgnify:CR=1 FL=1
MEIIIASIIGIFVAIAVGVLVYWLMRQQVTDLRHQLSAAQQTIETETAALQETQLLLSQKELELKYADELFIIMNQNTYPEDNRKIESLIYNNWKEE